MTASPAALARRPLAAASRLTRRRRRMAWIFLAPMLAALSLAAGWPLLRTIYLGLTDATLADPAAARFIGFANYLAEYEGLWTGLLADPLWWRSVRTTLAFAAASVLLETILGFAVALVLQARFPGRGLVRAAVLVPWAIPTVAAAKIWGWMLHDQFGVINALLLALGLVAAPIAWTAEPRAAFWAVVMVDVWKTTPFMALLLLAGLQMLPADLYEAARIDGVPPLKVFLRVTLPLMRPVLLVAVLFRLLDALRIYDLVYVLTSNSRETMSMSVYARQLLVDFQEVGAGSAAATLLFLVIAAVTAGALLVMRRRYDRGEAV